MLRALAEPVRASGEYVTYMGLRPLLRLLPDGDGHPVLVLPGFMASDRSTNPLRRLLVSLGYDAHGWSLGMNVGPTERVVERMPAILGRLARAADRTVSLVGWSLGGVYARHLARGNPDLVRGVVTLGSPARPEVHHNSNATPLFRALASYHTAPLPPLRNGPLPMPLTAVHTRSDGILHWETCLVEDAPNTENLRVRGSHLGLGHNPAVVYIIADRLAQPEGGWQPFQAPPPYRRIITREPGALRTS